MSGTRVPETIAEFNSYITTTDDYLQAPATPPTNATRLGLSAQNQTDWSDKRTAWTALYAKYQDPMQSTSAVKGNVKIFMDDFRAFANPLLNIMAASPNAIHDDEVILHFKIGKAPAHHQTTPFTDTVQFEAQNLGGGELQFSCRVSSDMHRPSLIEGADSVQVAYQIMVPDGGTPPPGGDPIPTPDDEGMQREIFTHAQFVFNAGVTNVGKRMVVFVRWYNTKHPELAGPWSAVRMIVIA